MALISTLMKMHNRKATKTNRPQLVGCDRGYWSDRESWFDLYF
jgi:hypothetical protein